MSQTTTPPLAGKVAWDGNDLVVTDPQTLKKLRRPALSASTAKSFQSCTARWVGERLLRDEAENPFDPAPLGTAAHAVLEELYKLPPAQRTKERAYEILKAAARIQWAAPEDEELEDRAERIANRTKWLAAVEEAYIGLWKIEDPTAVIVAGLETKIENIEINGVPTVGYIDRQSKQTKKPSGILVEDYKSGKYKEAHPRFGDDHGDQIRVYAEAIRVKTGVMPVGGRVLYTKVGRARPVSLSASNMKKTLNAFAKSWDKHNECMDAGTFPVKTGVLCSWCPLLKSCPSAQAEGFEDRTASGDLPSAVHLGIPMLRKGAEPAPAEGLELVEDDATETADQASAAPAETVTESVVAAHIDDSSNDPSTNTTEDEMPIITEDKAWEVAVNGELNPNSYTAGAAFGLASLAVQVLHKAGQGITKTNVSAMAQTLHFVSSTAQRSWTGSVSLQDGANTRMRGALHTTIETLPMPWGEDADAWGVWADTAVKRCRAITSVALSLFEDGIIEEPWTALNTVPAPTEPKVVKAPARTRAKAAPAPAASPALHAVPDVVEPEPVPAPAPEPEPKAAPAPASAEDDYDYIPSDDEFYDAS